MRLHWPPASLGLGTPLNLSSVAPDTRPVLRRWAALAPLVALAIALLVAGIDLLFFQGVTLQRLPEVGTRRLTTELVVSVYGSVYEELLFRVLVATLVAWLAYLALSFFMARPKLAAQWVGTLAAAALMGLWYHLRGRHDPFTVARVLTGNLVLETALGWVYWSKGLEIALLTHASFYLCLFFVLPLLG